MENLENARNLIRRICKQPVVISLAMFNLRINNINCYWPHVNMPSQLSAESMHWKFEIEIEIRQIMQNVVIQRWRNHGCVVVELRKLFLANTDGHRWL